MNAKQRRIWRRRETKRGGHTVRCASLRPITAQIPNTPEHAASYPKHGYHCNCNAKQNYAAGIASRADSVTN